MQKRPLQKESSHFESNCESINKTQRHYKISRPRAVKCKRKKFVTPQSLGAREEQLNWILELDITGSGELNLASLLPPMSTPSN